MAAKTSTARKRTTARRRKPVSRARVGRGLTVPRDVPVFARLGMRVALIAAKQMDTRKDVVMSRKDAAILRLTHEGCPTCKGNGQVFTQGKDGAFTGSRPCPAKPAKAKAGRMKVAMAARFGAERNTGLVGWTCPCGKKEKPRFRDAKEATKALRAHEKQKHGKSVGGAWYGQAVASAEETKPVTQGAPVTKVDTNSSMTDEEWEAQNSPLGQKAAENRGVCFCCGGKGALYSARNSQHTTTVCPICAGTGKHRANQPADA
ncbi:hypothetical protein [Streptomyces poriferorum]|uniref:Uncharacterized protein n=1 Tax=Streptomyces poriferorum TaxID=2798799 RepID=A0ABY9IYD8_9ACTN|nr:MULTISPECIES: hypothetical protein [unclassified Streptomyces]MDP5310420.1 hypothetical protein [Streptomyces sp. Alt4]WLQ60426.1 hypothetical protein P8A19_35605 [Streptomyces sp. Alt2]